MIHPFRTSRRGFAWLELLFLLALILLVLQLVPSFGSAVIWALYPWNWPRTVWFVVNVVVVIVLLGVRFGPDLTAQWRERGQRLRSERAQLEKSRELKQQREAIERLQENRRRRNH